MTSNRRKQNKKLCNQGDETQEGYLNNKMHAFSFYLFSWYEMKIHPEISSKDHEEKEMESISCYKMAAKLKQHNTSKLGCGLRVAQILYCQSFKGQAFPLSYTWYRSLFNVINITKKYDKYKTKV